MSGKYSTEYKSGNFCGTDLTPTREYVVNNETNERVGEVVRWQHEEAGKLIENGEWEPYGDKDNE